MSELISRINATEEAREATTHSIAQLASSGEFTELSLAESMAASLGDERKLYDEGWYQPPPNGVAVLIGQPPSFERLRFDTLRSEEFWPKPQNATTDESVIIVYASPVDRQTGSIGDLGFTLYRGDSPEVKDHLEHCFRIHREIAEWVQVGMSFREVHDHAVEVIEQNNLTNQRTYSQTDTSSTNIGHTIPWTHEEPTQDEQRVISEGDLQELKDLISRKRVFLNKEEDFEIPDNIAFTIEMRLESLRDPSLPLTFFHIIVAFKDGEKKVFTNFDQAFAAFGMDYMLS